MDKYSRTMEIPSYMSDIEHRLRAVSFMELAQEMAGKGAELLSFGDTKLKEVNGAWVLARMHVRFEKMPRWKDNVILNTWHKGLRGVQFLRDYQMCSEDGEVLVNSTSSWLVMDVVERKMLYGDALKDRIPAAPQSTDSAIAAPSPKVTVPADVTMEPAGVHVVSYSDVDNNRHTNNTRYVQWAMDVLPDAIPFRKDLRELIINFNKESHAGESIALSRGCAGSTWYVEGKSDDGQQNFIVKLVFEED